MKKVTIYQIKEDAKDARYKMFASLELLEQMGLKFDQDDYIEVWSGEMDVEDPEDVFAKLQGVKPSWFKGHSLSVSDLVEMGGVTYYCDSYGFEIVDGPSVDTAFRSDWANDTEYFQYGDVWFEK